jgi:hypothetical protein
MVNAILFLIVGYSSQAESGVMPRKLLTLPYKQEVAGSSPASPTR